MPTNSVKSFGGFASTMATNPMPNAIHSGLWTMFVQSVNFADDRTEIQYRLPKVSSSG